MNGFTMFEVYYFCYEVQYDALKEQGKIADYNIDSGLAIDNKGELIDTIDITIIPNQVVKNIELNITVTPNGI